MAQVNCGCCVYVGNIFQYLPQVSLKAHATIFSTAARTTLTQTFVNPSNCILEEASYRFPLYDGVSVVGFQCHVGTRLLHSKVKSKEQANIDYQDAVDRNESAAIMDQSPTESDVFTIRLGNVPANEKVIVEITFIGELKQDAQLDGVRYTLPNSIAPRYQNLFTMPPPEQTPGFPIQLEGISITADILLEKSSVIREIQSPSHSPKVSLGRVSSTASEASGFEPSQASATLRLGKDSQALLERDFVLVAKADGLDNPRALLESHPTIPGQRALMATLVPKFSLPPNKPEIVFVIDRSGSMRGNISTLKDALRVFLKSLPLGVCFNICSFGSEYSFLWPSSKAYDKSSLQEALNLVNSIGADMRGTNMQPAVEATVKNRLAEKDLEVLLLTDGEIMDQQSLFEIVRETANKHTARFFTLGIGHAVSHALIEGVARAGQGFSQSVLQNEELDKSVIRMLKGALTPHIYDYKLEVDYDNTVDQDFEIVNPASLSSTKTEVDSNGAVEQPAAPPISLFSDDFKELESSSVLEGASVNTLPVFSSPKTIQAPHKIPPLYPFIRTTAYLLLDPESDRIPHSLTFTATSKQGPLCLRIPITDIGKGETIHQLASRKAVVELEERHGWLEKVKDASGNPFKQLHFQTQEQIVARECQNLGIKYQITGKYCSFVALENDPDLTETPVTREPKVYKAERVRVSVATRNNDLPVTAHMVMRARTIPAASAGFASSESASIRSGGLFGSAKYVPPAPPSRVVGKRSVRLTSEGLFGNTQSVPPPPCAQYPVPARVIFDQAAASTAPSSGGLFGSAQPFRSGQHVPPPPASARRVPPLPGSGQRVSPPPASARRVPPPPASRQRVSPPPASARRVPPPPASRQQNMQSTQHAQMQMAASNRAMLGQTTASAGLSSGGLFGSAQSTPAPPAPSLRNMSEYSMQSAVKTPKSKVHSLIELQGFEGSWVWDQQLFDVITTDMNETRNKVNAILRSSGKRDVLTGREENVVATLMIMGLLKRDHQNSDELWGLVYEKADTWVQNELAEMQSEAVDVQSIGTWMSLL
ncbi:uncharacterized protein N7503_009869 [Penicillium pulvis]|uniref:uncharacterized protein n=1 Tax=Penicillium pulvis TaxID=1562058 RepID=UPI002546FEF7|nr:uncharacterized protein N7503_009869 [Penicillium pulvis]KAJ5784657.1 hypothetical protein N7503_009869 [Penicillium pulvis]